MLLSTIVAVLLLKSAMDMAGFLWVAITTSDGRCILWDGFDDRSLILIDFVLLYCFLDYIANLFRIQILNMFHHTVRRSDMIRLRYLDHIAWYDYLI